MTTYTKLNRKKTKAKNDEDETLLICGCGPNKGVKERRGAVREESQVGSWNPFGCVRPSSGQPGLLSHFRLQRPSELARSAHGIFLFLFFLFIYKKTK